MEEVLLKLIRENSEAASLLGDRVNWLRRPQEDVGYPACVLQRVSGVRHYHTKAPSRLSQSRVQFDVWALSYTAAKTAMRAVVASLTGYRGVVGNTNIQGIFFESERDLLDEESGAVNRLFRVSADALIWHTE